MNKSQQKFIIIIDLEKQVISHILHDEKKSELDSSFILLKFVGTKRWILFKDQMKRSFVLLKFVGTKRWMLFKDQMKQNIFLYVFGNTTILGTILELLLSLATSLIFSTQYAWKTIFQKFYNFISVHC